MLGNADYREDPDQALVEIAKELCDSGLFAEDTKFVSSSRNGVRLRCDGALVAIVHSNDCKVPAKGSQIWQRADYLVATDFISWSFYEVIDRVPSEVWRETIATTEDALRRFGGLAGIANTQSHVTISRSFAIEIPKFRRPSAAARVGRSKGLEPLLGSLCSSPHERLVNIFEMHQTLFGTGGVEQRPVVRKSLQTQFALRSDLSPALSYAPNATSAKRGDSITTYGVVSGHGEAREYVVRTTSDTTELDAIRYNVAYLLGIRRTKLFRAAYAERLYSVVLPAATVMSDSGAFVLSLIHI